MCQYYDRVVVMSLCRRDPQLLGHDRAVELVRLRGGRADDGGDTADKII